MEHSGDFGLLRLLCQYFSPLALPMKGMVVSPQHVRRSERRHARWKYLQVHMDTYIERSGNAFVLCFIIFSVCIYILPLLTVAAYGAIGMLVSLLHTVFLIFYKAVIDDAVGPIPPEEPSAD